MAKITLKQIRKELDELMKEKKKGLTSSKEINLAVNRARFEINLKYGKNWRERFKTNHKKSYDFSKPSQAQDLGDEWDHYAWTADDY
jgi:hypothetical protein